MTRWFYHVILCGMSLMWLTSANAQALYPFHSPEKEKTFTVLIQNLRCLVCQDENLASSDAKLAADLREDIYRRVEAGETADHIQQYLVARYGDFVLYKPPVIRRTYVLWFSPFILLVIGFILLWVSIRRHRLVSSGDRSA